MDDQFNLASVSVPESEPPVEPPVPPKKLGKKWIVTLVLAGILAAGLFATTLAGAGITYFLLSQRNEEETSANTTAAPKLEETATVIPGRTIVTPTPKSPTPKPPTPVPPTVVPPTVVPETSSDLQLLQACLDQGYACIPVPFNIAGPVTWYNGYEVEGYRAEYLGFDLEPGTVITAPFDGLVRKADGGGLVLKVKLPSGEEVGIKFYFQGYQDFEVLVDDRTSVSAGDPLAIFVRTIQWDQSSGVGPDFEYPGMLQIHLGDYNTPITPLVTWGTDGLGYLAADCRDTRSLVLFSPQHFQYLEELAKKGGFNLLVDPLLFPSGPVGEWISISDRCHGPVIANGKGVPEGYPAAMLIYETRDGEIRKILIDTSTMTYW